MRTPESVDWFQSLGFRCLEGWVWVHIPGGLKKREEKFPVCGKFSGGGARRNILETPVQTQSMSTPFGVEARSIGNWGCTRQIPEKEMLSEIFQSGFLLVLFGFSGFFFVCCSVV